MDVMGSRVDRGLFSVQPSAVFWTGSELAVWVVWFVDSVWRVQFRSVCASKSSGVVNGLAQCSVFLIRNCLSSHSIDFYEVPRKCLSFDARRWMRRKPENGRDVIVA